MKKTLSVICALMMCFAVAGCGNTKSNNNTAATTGTTTTTSKATTTKAETTTTTTPVPETTSTTTTPVTTSATTTTTTAAPKADVYDLFDISNGKYNLMFVGQNSVGGLQYIFFAKYIGKKEIKYATCLYSMYNAVNDPAYDDITNKSKFSVKSIGPVQKGQYILDLSCDTPSIYCKTASKLSLDSINLEYMDGTEDYIELGWVVDEFLPEEELNVRWTGIWTFIEQQFPDIFN